MRNMFNLAPGLFRPAFQGGQPPPWVMPELGPGMFGPSMGDAQMGVIPGANLPVSTNPAFPLGGGGGEQPPEEASPVIAEKYYVHGGKIVKELTHRNPADGQPFNTWQDMSGPNPALANVPDGTLVDPSDPMGSLARQGIGAPLMGQGNQFPASAQSPYGPYGAPPVNPTGGLGAFGQGGAQPAMAAQPQAPPAPQAPAAPRAGGPPAVSTPTPFKLPGAATGSRDAELEKNNLLYSLDNPRQALQNALLDMGANPFNPGDIFAQTKMRAAPGLGLAFQMSQLNNPALSGGAAGQGQEFDLGASFANFLKSVMAGGNVQGTLRNAAGALPGIIEGLREIRGAGQEGNVLNVNPLAQSLLDTLGSNMGEGTTGALAALLGPGMGQGAMQGYQRGLQSALLNAVRTGANDNMFGGGNGNDIWSYILGI